MSRYTDSGDIEEVLPKDVMQKIKDRFKAKSFKKLGSGRFGSAFKISPKKVLKITKDLKEYEYAKKIEGLKNNHIADVYETYYFEYNDTKYAIIIKEFCKVDENYSDRLIDSFVEYTGNKMSLSFISSEFLNGDVTKSIFDNYFKTYKQNQGFATVFGEEWYDMIMELKSKKIYVKDFNGANVGWKPSNNKLAIIELGLGYWERLDLKDADKIILKQGGTLNGNFELLGSAKELGVTPKITEHDMIAICDCGEKFSYQNSKKNILWECPECKWRNKIVE